MNSSDAAFVALNGHSTEEATHSANVVDDIENEQLGMKRSNLNNNNNSINNNINSNDNSIKSQNNINENSAKFNKISPNKINGADRLLNASYHHYTPEKTRNNMFTKATTPIQQRSLTNANSINVNKQYLHAMNTAAKTARVETSNAANTHSPLRTAVAHLENNYMRSDTVPVTTTASASATTTTHTFFPPTYHTMPSNLQKQVLSGNTNNPITDSASSTNEDNNNNSNTNNNSSSNTNTININNVMSSSSNSNTNAPSNVSNTNNKINNNTIVNHVRQTRPASSSQQREAMLGS